MLNSQGIVSGWCHLSAAFCLARSVFTSRFFHVTTELEQHQLSPSPIWFAGSSSLLATSSNIFISQSFQYVQPVLSSNNYLLFQRVTSLRHAKILQGWHWFCRASPSNRGMLCWWLLQGIVKRMDAQEFNIIKTAHTRNWHISAVRVKTVRLPWSCCRGRGREIWEWERIIYCIFLQERMDLRSWPPLPWQRIGEKCFLSVQSLIMSFPWMVGHKGLSPPWWSLIADCLLSILLSETASFDNSRESWRDTGPSKGTFIPSVRQTPGNTILLLHLSFLQWLDGFEMAEVW